MAQKKPNAAFTRLANPTASLDIVKSLMLFALGGSPFGTPLFYAFMPLLLLKLGSKKCEQ
jgi:hypothetical protein